MLAVLEETIEGFKCNVHYVFIEIIMPSTYHVCVFALCLLSLLVQLSHSLRDLFFFKDVLHESLQSNDH